MMGYWCGNGGGLDRLRTARKDCYPTGKKMAQAGNNIAIKKLKKGPFFSPVELYQKSDTFRAYHFIDFNEE